MANVSVAVEIETRIERDLSIAFQGVADDQSVNVGTLLVRRDKSCRRARSASAGCGRATAGGSSAAYGRGRQVSRSGGDAAHWRGCSAAPEAHGRCRGRARRRHGTAAARMGCLASRGNPASRLRGNRRGNRKTSLAYNVVNTGLYVHCSNPIPSAIT